MPAPTISGPVFTDIVAKVLALVDGVLDLFVSTTFTDPVDCCAIGTYTANITDCGNQLVCLLDQMVMALTGLGAYLFAALGASQTV